MMRTEIIPKMLICERIVQFLGYVYSALVGVNWQVLSLEVDHMGGKALLG